MKTHALERIDGGTVLVKSTRDHRNPPTAIRGTVVVKEAETSGGARVAIAFDYPQMFNTPAYHRTIELSPGQVDRLLASERDGVFEIDLDLDLNPDLGGYS